MKHWAMVLGLCFGLTVTAFADNTFPISGQAVANMDKFEKKFSRLMTVWEIPGAAVAIMRHHKLIYSRGFGYADVETQKPVAADALFRIASVSKSITAVALMKLLEDDGEVRLDSKVFDILDDIKPVSGKAPDPRTKNVTVRDVLQMTSGFIPNGKRHFDPMYGPWSAYLVKLMGYKNLPASCYDSTRMMLSMRMAGPSGQFYAYSNFDYCLAGLLIGKLSHRGYGYKAYEDYINEAILNPLGITDMHIASTDANQQDPKEVKYYRYQGKVDISHQSVSKDLPYGQSALLEKNFSNGGWLASAPDLVTFMDAFASGKIVSQGTAHLMLKKPRVYLSKRRRYFGLGWKVKQVGDKQYWYATGSFTGTNAFILHKSNGDSVAVVFNARPPIYHMWKDFRPRLQNIIGRNKRMLLNAIAAIPTNIG